MKLQIRRAKEQDTEGINKLLYQVLMVHHNGRPDIFRANSKKYTDEELQAMIHDDKTPIFVAVDEENRVKGYVFCIFQQYIDNNILTDIKTLYIDDLCVDATHRRKHIGSDLLNYVIALAQKRNFHNVTLNVWALNKDAYRFYEKNGMHVQKYGMEKII